MLNFPKLNSLFRNKSECFRNTVKNYLDTGWPILVICIEISGTIRDK